MENQGRFILFLIVSAGILFVFNVLNPPARPPAQAPPAATAPASGDTAPASASSAQVEKVVAAPAPAKRKGTVPARSVTIETGDYTAVFSNRGAVLISFSLKHYQDRHLKRPIQLVHPDPARPKPFSLSSPSLPDLSGMTFEVDGSSRELKEPGEEARLVFRARISGGLVVEKVFTFTEGTYLLGYEIAVLNAGRRETQAMTLQMGWAPSLGLEEFTGTQSRFGGGRVATFANARLLNEKPKKGNESVEIPPPVAWTALANQFFMAAFIPDPASGAAGVRVVRDYHTVKPPQTPDEEPSYDPKLFAARPLLLYQVPGLGRNEGVRRKGRAYIGPQEFSVLKGIGGELERVVDFGMFGFISVYMLKILQMFFRLFHNWGVAILLLSILVKIVLWWPTHSSYIHMSETQRKMKEIQPQLDALKKRYANDRQKLNQEMGILYQKAKINPMGGCLPMFLQIPIFFALYSTLVHTIELRGAPFGLWIQDLSLKDPWYVLPLLMGVSMIVQQRMSGQMSAGAPAGQQKFMMWFFPVFLTAISLQWPAGLLLYWVVTNLLSIVQQRMVNRQLKKARAES